jgi:hypothetical protein
MAIEYDFLLAGHTPLDQIAARALPNSAERPAASGRVLSADLRRQHGFGLTVASGQDGYYEAETDDGQRWEWQPATYVLVTFTLDKDPDRYDDALRQALTVVARLLTTGQEDAAFMLNGNELLLTRVDGAVHKHARATWWDHYRYPNEVIPG